MLQNRTPLLLEDVVFMFTTVFFKLITVSLKMPDTFILESKSVNRQMGVSLGLLLFSWYTAGVAFWISVGQKDPG